jgi:hypothetical protein
VQRDKAGRFIIASLSSIDTADDSILGKSIQFPLQTSILDGLVSFDDDSEMLLVGERPEAFERFRASLVAPGCAPTNTVFPAPKRRVFGCNGLVWAGKERPKMADGGDELGAFDLEEIMEGSNEDEFAGIVASKQNTAGSIADTTKISSLQDSRTIFSASAFFSDLMGAKECEYCREKLSLTQRRIKENRAHDVEDASVYFHLACLTARENIRSQKKLVHEKLLSGNYKLRRIVQEEAMPSASVTTEKRFKNVEKGASLVARKIKKCLTKMPKKLKRLRTLFRAIRANPAPETATATATATPKNDAELASEQAQDIPRNDEVLAFEEHDILPTVSDDVSC